MDRHRYSPYQLVPRATRRDQFTDPVVDQQSQFYQPLLEAGLTAQDQQSQSYQPLLETVLAAQDQQFRTSHAPGPSMSQLHGTARGMNSSCLPSHDDDTPPSFPDLSGSVFPPQNYGGPGGFEVGFTLPGETQFPQAQAYNGGEEMARLPLSNTSYQLALSVSASDRSLDPWMMHQAMMHQTTASLPVRSASHPVYHESGSPVASPLHQESRRSLPPHSRAGRSLPPHPRAGRAKGSAKSVELRDSCDPCFKSKIACHPRDGIKWTVCKRCIGNGNLCTYSPKKRAGKGRRSNARVPAMANPTGQQDNVASGLVPLGFEGPDLAAIFNMPASLSPAAGYLANYVPPYSYPSSQHPMYPATSMANNDHAMYESGVGFEPQQVASGEMWQPATNFGTPNGLQSTGAGFDPTLVESEETRDWAHYPHNFV